MNQGGQRQESGPGEAGWQHWGAISKYLSQVSIHLTNEIHPYLKLGK